MKRVDFSEVTGRRVLSFRNVSVGETAGPDLSGQCGVSKIYPPGGLPHGSIAEKTSPGALELKKSPSP
ncbi:MAG: hypothetical protein ACQEQO_06965 [Thermodesulfobacteriota bacterium]